jgi:F0F1-type ATP synthase membrane subunit b/b'
MNTLNSISEPNNANVISVIDVVTPLLNNMKTSKSRIDQLLSVVDAEKAQLRALYDAFEPFAKEIRDIAGIIDDAKSSNRTPEAILASASTRIINNAKKAGEPRDDAKRRAVDYVTAQAKKKYDTEPTADLLKRIDASVTKAYSKSTTR